MRHRSCRHDRAGARRTGEWMCSPRGLGTSERSFFVVGLFAVMLITSLALGSPYLR